MYKVCIKEASKQVLVDINNCEGDSLASQRMIFASISRAAWYNNISLAKKLISSSTLAKAHISIVGCKVVFLEPASFATAFDQVHSRHYIDQIDNL